MLRDVTSLSDDDVGGDPPVATPPAPAAGVLGLLDVVRTRPSAKRRATPEQLCQMEIELRRSVRLIVASSCRCYKKGKKPGKVNCFIPFRDPSLVSQIVKLRKTLRTMRKIDADATVIALVECAL